MVTGTTSPVPVICGDNAGQHSMFIKEFIKNKIFIGSLTGFFSFRLNLPVYLNIGYNSTTPIMLTMITSNLMVGGVASARNWKIRVSQIPCNEGFAGMQMHSLFFISSFSFLIFVYLSCFKTKVKKTKKKKTYQILIVIAPPGCLQYFTGSVGVIRSFNFFFESRGVNTARQLSFQDYTICIRQESVS